MPTLRLGTFCAEPVNVAVHRFAARYLTPYYINSYWATEHGGMVWSRCYGNEAQPLQPDTRSWPLPWIAGDVVAQEEDSLRWCATPDGQKGDVVIRRPYPYMAITIWRSEGFGGGNWRGDMRRWASSFVRGVGYVQGDTAIRYADGAFTFHGRSDEVQFHFFHLCRLMETATRAYQHAHAYDSTPPLFHTQRRVWQPLTRCSRCSLTTRAC